MSSSVQPDLTLEDSQADFKWRRWPWREAGSVGWLRVGVALLLLAIVPIILLVSLPLPAAILLSLVILGAVVPYFGPGYYEVNPVGITVRRGFWVVRRPWSAFLNFSVKPDGYWFTPATGLDRSIQARPRPFFLPVPLDPVQARQLTAYLTTKLPQ